MEHGYFKWNDGCSQRVLAVHGVKDKTEAIVNVDWRVHVGDGESDWAGWRYNKKERAKSMHVFQVSEIRIIWSPGIHTGLADHCSIDSMFLFMYIKVPSIQHLWKGSVKKVKVQSAARRLMFSEPLERPRWFTFYRINLELLSVDSQSWLEGRSNICRRTRLASPTLVQRPCS